MELEHRPVNFVLKIGFSRLGTSRVPHRNIRGSKLLRLKYGGPNRRWSIVNSRVAPEVAQEVAWIFKGPKLSHLRTKQLSMST